MTTARGDAATPTSAVVLVSQRQISRVDIFPLVPASVDDLGLDPFTFRVYAHACRRAGRDGLFHGGGVGVARTCRMSLRQVRRAVVELRRLGLLHPVDERNGCPTTYKVQMPTGATQAPVNQCLPVTGATQALEPVPTRHTKGIPLREGGARAPRPSLPASVSRGKGVKVDPALEPAVAAWLRVHPAGGRTGGLVQAIERVVAQGYTVEQLVVALDVVGDAKANPSKYGPKETPRWLAEQRRGRVPGFVLVPNRIDELLACVPEPAKPRPVYRWEGVS